MLIPHHVIEETLILDFEKVKEYVNNKDNMVYFLDVVDEDDNVIEESYFSVNQTRYLTFENDPLDVVDFELILKDISDKCFDKFGRLRPKIGIVDAYDDDINSNLNFVPKFGYEINYVYSHSIYFTIELPNPSIDYDEYQKFRKLIVEYIESELESFGYGA